MIWLLKNVCPVQSASHNFSRNEEEADACYAAWVRPCDCGGNFWQATKIRSD